MKDVGFLLMLLGGMLFLVGSARRSQEHIRAWAETRAQLAESERRVAEARKLVDDSYLEMVEAYRKSGREMPEALKRKP